MFHQHALWSCNFSGHTSKLTFQTNTVIWTNMQMFKAPSIFCHLNYFNKIQNQNYLIRLNRTIWLPTPYLSLNTCFVPSHSLHWRNVNPFTNELKYLLINFHKIPMDIHLYNTYVLLLAGINLINWMILILYDC